MYIGQTTLFTLCGYTDSRLYRCNDAIADAADSWIRCGFKADGKPESVAEPVRWKEDTCGDCVLKYCEGEEEDEDGEMWE
jgi:hypothetical protein